MEIKEKKVFYHKYYEDLSLVEIDLENNRGAMVFSGKDNLIYIFDLQTYQKYDFYNLEKEKPNKDSTTDTNDQEFTIFNVPSQYKNIKFIDEKSQKPVDFNDEEKRILSLSQYT